MHSSAIGRFHLGRSILSSGSDVAAESSLLTGSSSHSSGRAGQDGREPHKGLLISLNQRKCSK